MVRFPFQRRLLSILALGAVASGALGEEAIGRDVPARELPTVELDAEKPGVYVVEGRDVPAGARTVLLGQPSNRLTLRHRGEVVPMFVDDGGDGTFDDDDSFSFVVPLTRAAVDDPADETQLRVLQLGLAEKATGAPDRGERFGPGVRRVSSAPRSTRLERSLFFETDAIRATLTARDREVASLWYETSISHLASASYALTLGALDDRLLPTDEASSGVRLHIRLLGWSRPEPQTDMPDHHVVVTLNGVDIGTASWNGRVVHDLVIDDVPPEALGASNRIALRVLPRMTADGETPLVDMSFVDWVEVRYPVSKLQSHADSPVLVVREDGPHTADSEGLEIDLPPTARALATNGDRWNAEAGSVGAWLQGTADDAELWIVDEDEERRPTRIRVVDPSAWELATSIDYLMIAPQALLEGTERLASLHRARGLKVATIAIESVISRFGLGQPGPAAIRKLIRHLIEADSPLRFLLLVGDADWLASTHNCELVATGTVLSRFGPAASDQVFAAIEEDEHQPRLAIGRIPVRAPEELEAVVEKIQRYLASPRRDRAEALLFSDVTAESRARDARVRRRLTDAPLDLRVLGSDGVADADDVIQAFGQAPDIVHFVGHGGRFMWQLGGFENLDAQPFFDLEDVAALPALPRPPIVLSISCATAPFDHPSASSLGEAMVLDADSGAIAFVGAPVRLHTPVRASEILIRSLLTSETVGEALVSAKRVLGIPRVSQLYNLLGDPALPLR